RFGGLFGFGFCLGLPGIIALLGGAYTLTPCGLAFGNFCSLTTQLTEVVQLGPTNAAKACNADVLHLRAMKGDNALDTYTVVHLAQGYRFSNAAAFTADADAFKILETFLVTFHDLKRNADGITRLKV